MKQLGFGCSLACGNFPSFNTDHPEVLEAEKGSCPARKKVVGLNRVQLLTQPVTSHVASGCGKLSNSKSLLMHNEQK